ncbi:MAG: hypothetical protein QM619_07530 [Micropruina sp.]|uniref:hypothetical protein n=1 Tax=Micropruina sp. TaxID=2737536 RepID=UPI0039E5A90F
MLILSGTLLPLDTAPAWMRAVASVNSINWVVQAERALLDGELCAIPVLWGWIAALALAAVGVLIGVRTIRKSD